MPETETSVEVKRCIYCDQHKPLSDFSLEHIFPNSMGGSVCSDLFKTRDVCRHCNSTMGVFVDGPVIKSWFAKNAETVAYRQFVDLSNLDSWMPFAYMGVSKTLHFGEHEVCEIWLGPSGEHLYHIHDKDDERYDTYAGGNPIARRDDPGRAYLFLTTADELRCSLAIRSFTRQFKKATRYAGNFGLPPSEMMAGTVTAMPSEREAEHALLATESSSGKEWKMRFAVKLDFEQRFLAKLARGMGYKLFGAKYLDTLYGAGIRNALWERDPASRAKLMRGMSMFSEPAKALKGRTCLPGAYSILLWAQPEAFHLLLTLPDGNLISVVVSDDPRLWSGPEFDSYRDGTVYIVAPQIDTFIGPVGLPDFYMHLSGQALIPQICKLESKRRAAPI